MDPATDNQFNVIQFLEAPYTDVADYVCVPTSWVQSRGPYDRKVKVSYPIEDPTDTEERVRKRKKKSDEWTAYLSVVKYSTDDYNEANRYIQDLIPITQKADNSLSSVMDVVKRRRSSRKVSSSAKTNMMEALGLSATLKNKHKSTKAKRLKRKALQSTDEEAHNKRSRVNPSEADDEFLKLTHLARESQSLLHKVFNEKMCTQETPIEKTYNSTENRPPVNQNLLDKDPFLDPQVDKFRKRVLRELRTSFQIYSTALFAEMVNIFCNATWPCEYRKNAPAETPRLNENIRNEDQAKENDTDDDADKPQRTTTCPKPIKTVVLPPEYDANDSKWTLNYREPAPGLVELMPHTGVYVKAIKLDNCKRLSNDCKSLARKLLCEIFTASALRTCSWTGARAKAFDQDGSNVRPGLDENARTVLMTYVAQHAKNEGWKNFENQSVLNSMRNKMQEMRFN